MIKEIFKNKKTGFIISGTGKKYNFTTDLYFKAVKFVMKKFKMPLINAKNQINYMLVTDLIKKGKKFIYLHNGSKRATDARLKNIIELDYAWEELWNLKK